MTRRQWITVNVKLWGALVLYIAGGIYGVYACFHTWMTRPDSLLAIVIGPIVLFLYCWTQRGLDAYIDSVRDEALEQIRNQE